MTRDEQKMITRLKRLAKKECCNLYDGTCLDVRPCQVWRDEPQPSHICPYLMDAVLPLDKNLQRLAMLHLQPPTPITHNHPTARLQQKKCSRCFNAYIPTSNRQRYCEPCGRKARRAKKAEWMRQNGNGKKAG